MCAVSLQVTALQTPAFSVVSWTCVLYRTVVGVTLDALVGSSVSLTFSSWLLVTQFSKNNCICV